MIYGNWVYGESNDWKARARQSSMTLPCWRLEDGPGQFSRCQPACMRQKRGVERRSKRGANSDADLARESEVVGVAGKGFLEFIGLESLLSKRSIFD